MPAAEHAQREPEGGRRFALAGSCVNDEEALFGGLSGHLCILHAFSLRHLGAMALDLQFVDRFAHVYPFMVSGSPATTRRTRFARAAIR